MMAAADEKRTTARNVSTSYALRAALALSVLLITPYLFRRLGQGGFGTWSVMYTVTTVFSLLEVGFYTSLVKFVPELRATESWEELRATVSTGAMLMGALGLVALVVSTLIAVFASGLAAGGERDAFRAGLIVLGLGMLIRFPASAFSATLIGWQRWDLFNLTEISTVVLFAAGAVVAVESGAGVFGLAVAYAVALVAGAALSAVLLRRLAPELSLRPRRGDRATRRRVGAFGAYNLVIEGMTFVAQRVDTIVIAAVRSATAAAPYAAAVKLRSGVQSGSLPISNLLLPAVAELRARKATREAARRFILTTRLALQITLPLAVAIALFSEDLVHTWLGPTAPSVTATIIVVLMVVELVDLTVNPSSEVLVASGRMRFLGAMAIVGGTANLVLSIVLVSAHGAIGAAVATLLTSTVLAPVLVPLACRALDCPLKTLVRQALLPATAASVPPLAIMVAVWSLMGLGTLRLIVGLAAGWGAALAVASIQVGPRRGLALIRASIGRGEATVPTEGLATSL